MYQTKVTIAISLIAVVFALIITILHKHDKHQKRKMA
jgi:hypothetical protein